MNKKLRGWAFNPTSSGCSPRPSSKARNPCTSITTIYSSSHLSALPSTTSSSPSRSSSHSSTSSSASSTSEISYSHTPGGPSTAHSASSCTASTSKLYTTWLSYFQHGPMSSQSTPSKRTFQLPSRTSSPPSIPKAYFCSTSSLLSFLPQSCSSLELYSTTLFRLSQLSGSRVTVSLFRKKQKEIRLVLDQRTHQKAEIRTKTPSPHPQNHLQSPQPQSYESLKIVTTAATKKQS